MPPGERQVDVLLIGGGVAAARCARTLRRAKFAGSILLVGDESQLPYNRPPLSKELLRGEVARELIAAEPTGWYERQRVEPLTGVAVVELDPAALVATLADGTRVRFRQCLLATGAAPRRPPLGGAEHALLLRTVADAEAIRSRAVGGRRAVVIGGGFIGVEVAASLAAVGMAVTVLEMAEALWGGTLGPEVSAWAAEALAAAGGELRVGARVTRLDADAAWLGVERLPADLLVAGVGVSPRTELAEAAGLTVADGIVADAGGATSAPGIFAAGDVARVEGLRVEHWHAAREGGEAAARAMLGEPPGERPAPWVYSEFAGHLLDVVGHAPGGAETAPVGDGRGVAYLAGGRVTQLAIFDSALPVEAARALVARRPRVGELEAALTG
jgi:NADPH-dependent 2,4-dienoyl-CoA reductase/sulfur reductase-like enzyme